MKYRGRRRPVPAAAPLQPLEDRRLMSTVVGPVISPSATMESPAAVGTTVAGYTPAQMQAAYGLSGLTFNSGKTGATGAGQTIAIVDAYNDPDIAADLATFSTKFALATASLTVVSQTGSTTALPATNASWAQEISLDVEWAHAIAPAAKLLLVEAKSSGTADLLAGVSYARTVSGVAAVSISWGGSEFAGETAYDSIFTTPAGHTGITFVASAGDDGSTAGAQWPAASPGVLSVGGTDLTLTSSGTYSSETGWADGGGGTSRYEAEPSYQYAVQSTGYRTVPDVAYDADPSTGVAVYDSLASQGDSGWMEFGGTSAGAPQWAALIAVADQGRATVGLSALAGPSNTLPSLYALYSTSSDSTDFHDITSGSTSKSVSAAAGYDEVSGLGTPRAAALIGSLERSTLWVQLTQAKTATATTGTLGTAVRSVAVGAQADTVATPTVAAAAPTAGAAADATPLAELAAPAVFTIGGLDVPTAVSAATWVTPVSSGSGYDAVTAATETLATVATDAPAAGTADLLGPLTAGGTASPDLLGGGVPALSHFATGLMAARLPAVPAAPAGSSFAAALAASTRAARPLGTAVAAGAVVAPVARDRAGPGEPPPDGCGRVTLGRAVDHRQPAAGLTRRPAHPAVAGVPQPTFASSAAQSTLPARTPSADGRPTRRMTSISAITSAFRCTPAAAATLPSFT